MQNLKEILCKIMICLIALYMCDTCAITKVLEMSLLLFKIKSKIQENINKSLMRK